MTLRDRYRRICAFIFGAMASIIVFAAAPANAQSGPFSALAGSWGGGGKIDFSDGSSERLRCRATNAVGGGGSSAQLTLRCASDSYNVTLTSNVTSQGGAVSGTWSESNRGIGGTLSGRTNGTTMQLQVLGAAFAAGLSLTVSGNRQVVQISAPASQIKLATI